MFITIDKGYSLHGLECTTIKELKAEKIINRNLGKVQWSHHNTREIKVLSWGS